MESTVYYRALWLPIPYIHSIITIYYSFLVILVHVRESCYYKEVTTMLLIGLIIALRYNLSMQTQILIYHFFIQLLLYHISHLIPYLLYMYCRTGNHYSGLSKNKVLEIDHADQKWNKKCVYHISKWPKSSNSSITSTC